MRNATTYEPPTKDSVKDDEDGYAQSQPKICRFEIGNDLREDIDDHREHDDLLDQFAIEQAPCLRAHYFADLVFSDFAVVGVSVKRKLPFGGWQLVIKNPFRAPDDGDDQDSEPDEDEWIVADDLAPAGVGRHAEDVLLDDVCCVNLGDMDPIFLRELDDDPDERRRADDQAF